MMTGSACLPARSRLWDLITSTAPLHAGFDPIPPTSLDELGRVVSALQPRAQSWVDTDMPSRAALLRSCLTSTLAVAEAAATAATQPKGSCGGGIGEEL